MRRAEFQLTGHTATLASSLQQATQNFYIGNIATKANHTLLQASQNVWLFYCRQYNEKEFTCENPYKLYTITWHSTGIPNVTVSWPGDHSILLDAGQTLIIKAEGSFNVE